MVSDLSHSLGEICGWKRSLVWSQRAQLVLPNSVLHPMPYPVPHPVAHLVLHPVVHPRTHLVLHPVTHQVPHPVPQLVAYPVLHSVRYPVPQLLAHPVHHPVSNLMKRFKYQVKQIRRSTDEIIFVHKIGLSTLIVGSKLRWGTPKGKVIKKTDLKH